MSKREKPGLVNAMQAMAHKTGLEAWFPLDGLARLGFYLPRTWNMCLPFHIQPRNCDERMEWCVSRHSFVFVFTFFS